MERVSAGTSGMIIAGTFAALVILEQLFPLRRSVEKKLSRDVRNLSIATLSAVAVQLVETPIIQPLAAALAARGIGITAFVGNTALRTALALLLMDYTLYIWHVLVHKQAFLWRFHQPHHVDLDMDASTALRFHFAEILVSIPWRAAQVVLIGATPLAFSLWQLLLIIEVMFHHANLRLPIGFERILCNIIVTPRMHGIHHSVVASEQNSNWSSGLALWDRLHGTLRLEIPQDEIVIGVPAYCTAPDARILNVLAMPFVDQRESFSGPDSLPAQDRDFPAPHTRLAE